MRNHNQQEQLQADSQVRMNVGLRTVGGGGQVVTVRQWRLLVLPLDGV